MSSRSRFLALTVFLGALLASGTAQQPTNPAQPSPQPAQQGNSDNPSRGNSGEGRPGNTGLQPCPAGKPLDCKISGPHTHENLTIFLLHGPDQFKLDRFLTLAEAMEQKRFLIHETQSVNQLQMENLSDLPVVVLSGDIFKGGQQDRFARFDLVVPPRSGKLPLACYCVEQTAARWLAKLDAINGSFQSSPGQVTGNPFRVAGRYAISQPAVWKNVEYLQSKLRANAGVAVKARESDSSLALSLQVKEVQENSERYASAFKGLLEGKQDVIGFVYAINGKVIAADVYGSRVLFERIWPRMLRSITIEAFAELERGKKVSPVTAKAVREFLAEGDRGKANQRQTLADHREQINEAEKAVRFESQQGGTKGAFLRRNYLQIDRQQLEQMNRERGWGSFRNPLDQRNLQPAREQIQPPR